MSHPVSLALTLLATAVRRAGLSKCSRTCLLAARPATMTGCSTSAALSPETCSSFRLPHFLKTLPKMRLPMRRLPPCQPPAIRLHPSLLKEMDRSVLVRSKEKQNMNNLYRELAPISDKAWAQIEEEASRTLKRHLAARRVVDVPDPKGLELAAVGTGHVRQLRSPGDGIQAVQRDAKALVELRVPFELARQAIDDVERGATDSDWSPVKEAARKIAFAEDRAVFDGYAAAGIQGIREGSSNTPIALPSNVKGYSSAVAQAVGRLRLAGVNGPYALILGAQAYTAASGGSDEGYPVFHHIERVVDGGIIWAPAIEGGFVVTTRSGDFELDIGQDISIGYQTHSGTTVELYLQETFTFRLLTTEAAVVLAPGQK